MTLEQKAKAYDEALERARMLNSGKDVDVEAGTTTCEYIFPELRESEDERIRKEIVSALQFANDNGVYDKHLAWLEKQKDFQTKVEQRMEYLWDKLPDAHRVEEGSCTPEEWKTLGAYMELEMNFDKDSEEKQKEQKPAEYLSKEKVFAIMNKLTSLSFCVPLGSEEEKKIHEITCDVSSLLDYPIEKQKPVEFDEYKIIKKHITEDMLSSEVNKRLTECGWYVTDEKPAEWSEEDKKMLSHIVDMLKVKNEKFIPCDTEVSWLKGLLNRFQLQPKQEWSEEDEDMLNRCISSIDEAKENRYYYKETDGDTSYDEEIKWLKSLHSQSKSEWSEDFEEIKPEAFKASMEKIWDFLKHFKEYKKKKK